MKKVIEHWWQVVFSPEGVKSKGKKVRTPGAFFVTMPPFDRHRALAFLLPLLQAKGFQITPDRQIRLQKLIDLLPAETSAGDLAAYLCPIFATDIQSQMHFHEVFSQLTFLFIREEKEISESDTQQSESPKKSKDDILEQKTSKREPKTPEKAASELENEPSKPDPVAPDSPQNPLVPDLEKCTDPPYVWKIAPDDHIPLETKAGFGRTMTRLRSRELSNVQQIDWKQTIRDTALKAGMLTIRNQQRSRPIEYLMLVERFSEEDHRALMFDRLWQMLRDQDVLVDRFFHDGDLRNCFNEQFPLGISLRDLRYRFGNARLLVLGTGHRLLNPVTGQPAEWTSLLPDWRQRALLTPISKQEWGIQEKNITALFPLFPAAWESVEYLSEQSGGEEKKHFAELPNYVKEAADWQPIELGEPLMHSLRQHFDEVMCAWIAACALWPSLHFDLTLRMGRLFSTPENNLLTLDNFTKICRLEWFANGFIPRPARGELLEYLEARFPDKLQLATEVLLALLEENLTEIPNNSRARAEYQINLAILRLMNSPNPDAESVQKLRTVIKRLDRQAEITDFVLPASVERMMEKLGLEERKENWTVPKNLDMEVINNVKIPKSSIYYCDRKEQIQKFQEIFTSVSSTCIMFGLVGDAQQNHTSFVRRIYDLFSQTEKSNFYNFPADRDTSPDALLFRLWRIITQNKNKSYQPSMEEMLKQMLDMNKGEKAVFAISIDRYIWEQEHTIIFFERFISAIKEIQSRVLSPKVFIFWSFKFELENIPSFFNENNSFFLLPKLEKVNRSDIKEWFLKYLPEDIEEYDLHFNDETYDMAEVEKKLTTVIEKINLQRETLNAPKNISVQLEAGILFSSHFRLEKLIAKGGLSQVWKGFDIRNGTDIAIKIFNQLDGEEETLALYEYEFTQYLKGCKNISAALDVGSEYGYSYLIFPLYETAGIELIGKIQEEQVWKIIHDIGSALKYMHGLDRPVYHNDIKPEHFLKDKNGDYVLSDFGFSTHKGNYRWYEKWHELSFAAASKVYHSSEEYDIRKFGISLFQLITGELPSEFKGNWGNYRSAYMRIETKQLWERVSSELAKLIHRCLNDASKASAKEIVELAENRSKFYLLKAPPLKTFIIYSRADARYKAELQTHLLPFVKNGLLEKWVDSDLLPGEDWEKRIEKELEAAHLVILLVSADAINSDFIEKKELKIALEKKRAGSARVAPILVRDCFWEMHDQIAEMQILPKDESGNIRSISSWNSSDSAWTSCIREIKKLVDEIRGALSEEARANSEAIKKQVQIELEKNEHKRSRIDEAVWQNVLKVLDQVADSQEKIESLEIYLHDEDHQNHRAEATALLETLKTEQKVDEIKQNAIKILKEQEEATLLKRYEVVRKRKKGIVNTIKSLERRILQDEEELNFQLKKVSTSDGQLELQLRRAKIIMLEERISNYADQLEKMKSSLAQQDELIVSTGHPKEKVDKEGGTIKKTAEQSRSDSSENKVEGGRVASGTGSRLQRSEFTRELQDIQDKKGQPEMIFVQGGTFKMGGKFEATLSDYEIGKYPVTQQLWQEIMKDNPSHFKGDNLPVERVSWDDCQEFLKKLNAKFPGKNYRLPTEAEWEFAARGGEYSRGYEYAGSNKLEEVGWFWENSGETVLSGEWNINKIQKFNCRTHSVGHKIGNELGIHDMSGNVWEWCQDWYGQYLILPQINPSGANTGFHRVFRGGSWDSVFSNCKVTYRYYTFPGNRSFNLGFRLARSISL